MNNSSLISIIVPVYKVEEYLDECVTSIINQTYTNLEIILVDDGSPDSCPHLCDEWAKKDERIKVVHKKNGGLSSARNAGLEIAMGEYICFVDSDDFITPDYVEVMYERIKNDTTVGIVSGMIYRYQDNQTIPFNEKWNLENEKIISPEDFTSMMMDLSASFTVWNKLYRRDLIKNVRFREGRNNEDTLFMYDLGKQIKENRSMMVEIPHYVYYYRFRPNSICTSSKKPLMIDVIQNLEDMMDDCKYNDVRVYQILYKRYVDCLYHFLDKMFLVPEYKLQYFDKYRAILKKIPFSYIQKHYPANDFFYIMLIRLCPALRNLIRKSKENFIKSRQ